jgi:alkanesulfonate monooxygenase SsuD/methylene tetrahydromethanopterin reductase-like flavin-dependent oxidoreductase (luciferase family)
MASNPTPPVPRNPIAVDGGLIFDDMANVRAKVEELKAIGYDGMYSFEGSSDGFMPFVIAAEHTETQLLSTQVAVAFARNPLTLAYQANDLQMLSKGRFILGMGTQAKAEHRKALQHAMGQASDSDARHDWGDSGDSADLANRRAA